MTESVCPLRQWGAVHPGLHCIGHTLSFLVKVSTCALDSVLEDVTVFRQYKVSPTNSLNGRREIHDDLYRSNLVNFKISYNDALFGVTYLTHPFPTGV